MLDVDKTIYSSVIDALGQLRYQAKDDPKRFKAILTLIIMNDMLEWAFGQTDNHCILEKLEDMRHRFILCNTAFKQEYTDNLSTYVNVNTPQTSATWKRVWDVAGREGVNYISPVDKLPLVGEESPCEQCDQALEG